MHMTFLHRFEIAISSSRYCNTLESNIGAAYATIAWLFDPLERSNAIKLHLCKAILAFYSFLLASLPASSISSSSMMSHHIAKRFVVRDEPKRVGLKLSPTETFRPMFTRCQDFAALFCVKLTRRQDPCQCHMKNCWLLFWTPCKSRLHFSMV